MTVLQLIIIRIMPYSSSRFAIHPVLQLGVLTHWMAGFVMLISLLNICGWIWDVTALKSVLPGLATMKPLTAMGCFFAGAALWLRRPHGVGTLRHRLGLGLSVLAALIGGLVLLEYQTNMAPGLDLWFFRESVLAEGSLNPGRPAPGTALCLLLIGVALMALDTKIVWLAPILALQALLISLLALVGYAYGVSALYQIRPYTSIALHTAVLLFLLALGLLTMRPSPYLTRLISPLAGGVMARQILPVAIVFPFALGWLQRVGQRFALYDADFGFALFVTLHIVVFSGLIYWTADRLNQADAGREAGFAALQDSEERFRLLVDAAPYGILMTDPEGRIQLANRQAEILFGYAASHLPGENVALLLREHVQDEHYGHPESIPATLHAGGELLGVRRDGSEFVAQTQLGPLETRAGKMLLFTLVDITERKRTETERNRFVALANASVEFIGMCDQNFKPFYVNPAGIRMVGFENLADACAVRVQDFFFPEDQGFITDTFFPQVIREGHAEIEIRFRNFKTGQAIWMLYNVFNLCDDSGSIIGWATISRNIHDRKRLEERFRVAIESAPSAMLMIDRAGRVVLTNAKTNEIFGYRHHELLGQPVDILLPERFREKHLGQRASFFQTPKMRVMGAGNHFVGLRRDGSEFPAEIGLNPIKTEEGQFVLAAIVDITERKRLEARFRAAIEATPSGMLMIDGAGFVVLVNSQTEKLFGYSRGEILGRLVEMLIPERFRTQHPLQRQAFFRAPVSRPMGVGRDLFGQRKDGSEFPIEIGLNPINTDEGAFVLASIVDISERKRAERALRESEERLRLLVEGVQDYAIVMLDPEGRFASWNIGAKRIYGYEADEIIDQHFSRFYTAEDIQTGKPTHELKAATEEGRYEEEGLRVRKDGSRYWASVILTALRDTTGRLRGFAKVTRDITERKQTEERILALNAELEQRVAKRTLELETANARLLNELTERQRAEAEIERFFNMSVDMICIIGAEGYFHRMNPAFETTLGYSLKELASRPMLDFVHAEDAASTKAEIERLAPEGPTIRFENRYRCKDDSYRWLGWAAQPAPDGTLYAIARDITERKKDEARIAAALQEKDVLLKEIHHRVKNNLQVIASLLRLQADTLNDPAMRELFEDSQRRVRSMALVHEQLYQSSGLASINMAEYIASLVNYIRRSYSHSLAVIEVKLEVRDITLDIERAVPLGLIISELVANSFKHAFTTASVDRRGELRINFTNTLADELLLEVGDNGQGIPDSVDIDHPSSMGLHLVNAFVLQFNGRMTVQRRPSAVFSIIIPKKRNNHD